MNAWSIQTWANMKEIIYLMWIFRIFNADVYEEFVLVKRFSHFSEAAWVCMVENENETEMNFGEYTRLNEKMDNKHFLRVPTHFNLCFSK